MSARYATQSLRVLFPTDVYLNTGEYKVEIPKSGDMITKIRLMGVQFLDETVINNVEFLVGSNVLESLSGTFVKIQNALETPLEKIQTQQTFVTTGNIEIPFSIVRKGYFMYKNPTIRISFNGSGNAPIKGVYFLVDYRIIENPPTKFIQKIRQVQELSTVLPPYTSSTTLNTSFVGPVFHVYFTVQNVDTRNFVEDSISNVTFMIGTLERFELSGKYLRYTEPLKRLGSAPRIPVYMYSFSVSDSMGSLDFSRIDTQKFILTLNKLPFTSKVTVWAQNHNWYHFSGKLLFESYEFLKESIRVTSTAQALPITISPEIINNSVNLNVVGGVQISSTNPTRYAINTTDSIINTTLSSPGYSNVLISTYVKGSDSINYHFPSNSTAGLCGERFTNKLRFAYSTYLYDQMKGLLITAPNQILRFCTNSNGDIWIFTTNYIYRYNYLLQLLYSSVIQVDTKTNVISYVDSSSIVYFAYTYNNSIYVFDSSSLKTTIFKTFSTTPTLINFCAKGYISYYLYPKFYVNSIADKFFYDGTGTGLSITTTYPYVKFCKDVNLGIIYYYDPTTYTFYKSTSTNPLMQFIYVTDRGYGVTGGYIQYFDDPLIVYDMHVNPDNHNITIYVYCGGGGAILKYIAKTTYTYVPVGYSIITFDTNGIIVNRNPHIDPSDLVNYSLKTTGFSPSLYTSDSRTLVQYPPLPVFDFDPITLNNITYVIYASGGYGCFAGFDNVPLMPTVNGTITILMSGANIPYISNVYISASVSSGFTVYVNDTQVSSAYSPTTHLLNLTSGPYNFTKYTISCSTPWNIYRLFLTT